MRAAFAAAALILAGTAVAQAQTAPVDQMSPAPAASPAGQTGGPAPQQPGGAVPGGGPSQSHAPVPSATSIGHYPIIDVIATFTQPAYYAGATVSRTGAVTNGQLPGYDPVDVGGTVRIPITRKFNLVFDRVTEGTLNQPLDCVLQPGVPGGATGRACSADTRDVVLQYHATYAFDRFVTLDVGDSFRHRLYASNGSGVSSVPYNCANGTYASGCTISSTEHHFGYAGLTYTTKPIHELWNSQFAFAETLDMQNVDHHVAMQCTATNKLLPQVAAACPAGVPTTYIVYYDENPGTSRYYETTQGVTWILPIDIKHGTTFTLNERWGALNFYENPTVSAVSGTLIGEPYRWDSALTYQLNKRFSPGFTLSVRHSDFHSAPQGAPFVTPNVIHVGSWDVIGTFHVDTNSWFH